MNSSEEREAILRALPRGLYADNLLEIVGHARTLAREGRHNVVLWVLIQLGFSALADYWDSPVQNDLAEEVEERLLPACEQAVMQLSSYAIERFARELVQALHRFASG